METRESKPQKSGETKSHSNPSLALFLLAYVRDIREKVCSGEFGETNKQMKTDKEWKMFRFLRLWERGRWGPGEKAVGGPTVNGSSGSIMDPHGSLIILTVAESTLINRSIFGKMYSLASKRYVYPTKFESSVNQDHNVMSSPFP
jgi:hypothetical protein